MFSACGVVAVSTALTHTVTAAAAAAAAAAVVITVLIRMLRQSARAVPSQRSLGVDHITPCPPPSSSPHAMLFDRTEKHNIYLP